MLWLAVVTTLCLVLRHSIEMGSCGSMHDLPHEQLSTINFGELQFTYFEQTSLKDFNDYWH